jgi:hypothetical protein
MSQSPLYCEWCGREGAQMERFDEAVTLDVRLHLGPQHGETWMFTRWAIGDICTACHGELQERISRAIAGYRKEMKKRRYERSPERGGNPPGA